VSWAALCTTLMCEKPTTPTMTTPSDIANNAWMITPARLGRAIGAGIMESQWDACMLFSCLAHDPGKIGITEDYQGKLGAVTGPGAHNSLSVHWHRRPCGLAGEQDRRGGRLQLCGSSDTVLRVALASADTEMDRQLERRRPYLATIGMFDAIVGNVDLRINARGSASRPNLLRPCLATGPAIGSRRPLRSQAVECQLADLGEVTGNAVLQLLPI
jgi:hypothetical protein